MEICGSQQLFLSVPHHVCSSAIPCSPVLHATTRQLLAGDDWSVDMSVKYHCKWSRARSKYKSRDGHFKSEIFLPKQWFLTTANVLYSSSSRHTLYFGAIVCLKPSTMRFFLATLYCVSLATANFLSHGGTGADPSYKSSTYYWECGKEVRYSQLAYQWLSSNRMTSR
jgi:hypothetical protein